MIKKVKHINSENLKSGNQKKQRMTIKVTIEKIKLVTKN